MTRCATPICTDDDAALGVLIWYTDSFIYFEQCLLPYPSSVPNGSSNRVPRKVCVLSDYSCLNSSASTTDVHFKCTDDVVTEIWFALFPRPLCFSSVIICVRLLESNSTSNLLSVSRVLFYWFDFSVWGHPRCLCVCVHVVWVDRRELEAAAVKPVRKLPIVWQCDHSFKCSSKWSRIGWCFWHDNLLGSLLTSIRHCCLWGSHSSIVGCLIPRMWLE